MSLTARDQWIKAGRPYRLCRPMADLQATLRGHGYVVYDYPDDAHLMAIPPEDHTGFSATGWPGASPFGRGMAIDIMPPDPAKGLPTLAQLGAKMVADKMAGRRELAPLKYQNWTDDEGACWHDSWQPNYARRPSTDKGHVHQSARTDYVDSDAMVHYDPVAELMDASADKGDNVSTLWNVLNSSPVDFGGATHAPGSEWWCDGSWYWPVGAAEASREDEAYFYAGRWMETDATPSSPSADGPLKRDLRGVWTSPFSPYVKPYPAGGKVDLELFMALGALPRQHLLNAPVPAPLPEPPTAAKSVTLKTGESVTVTAE